VTDRTHACPGGCGHQVLNHEFACRTDWFRLPLDIRRGITGNYRRDPNAHFAAVRDAIDWYRENPREVRGG